MKEKLKFIILVPYVASTEEQESPSAEATFFFEQYFSDAERRQIVGDGLEGSLYVKEGIGLYIIGEGKTNASINCTALLNDQNFDFSETKFIEFGCCGCMKEVGVVGDIYLIGETFDMELGHHADSREEDANASHSWYPNKSFERYGYVNLENEFFNKAYEKIKSEKAQTTQEAKDFMAKSFNNEPWALRDPKIMKAASVTADAYWKGNYDHENANFIANYYNCKYPFAATNMEDIAVAQVFNKYNMLDQLIVFRYAVNTDVFMDGQTPLSLWGEGNGSFDSSGFDSFNNAFPVITKKATELVWKIIDAI